MPAADAIQQNSTKTVQLFLADAGGIGVSGITNAQVVARRRKAGGAFTLRVVQVSEWIDLYDGVNAETKGLYEFAVQASDSDTLGALMLTFTGPNVDALAPAVLVFEVVGLDFLSVASRVSPLPSDPASQSIILTRLGSPSGSSLSADIDTAMVAAQRAALLAGANRYASAVVRDSNGKPTTYRIDYYDTAAHATAHDGVTGLVFSCTITATYAQNLLTTFLQAGGLP